MHDMQLIDVKNKKPDINKLIDYGFHAQADGYRYHTRLVQNDFELAVHLSPAGKLYSSLTDLHSAEVYTLHTHPGTVGKFVGAIRAEYQGIIDDIIAKGFEDNTFKSEQAQQLIHLLATDYAVKLEYLWPKFPHNAIARRPDNQKWFLAMLTVERDKLGLSGQGTIEIIDLKMAPGEKQTLIDNQRYLAGYHMNKDNWFTLCLDGRVPLAEIAGRLAISYQLVS